ncbi:MAG: discoidin domain-containing protein [Lachnospiraceae bacterium]|nr:discoidin domain-containing protein [Lachnospiraceae bacterium]
MKLFKKAVALALTLTLACPAFTMSANAQEKRINEYPASNEASRAKITATVPGDTASDTLAAIVDGVRWPEKPHSGSGPNPYAWTNYASAQKYGIGMDRPSSLKFEFPEETEVAQICIYYFVDSWSASLPKHIEIDAYDGNGNGPLPWATSYNAPIKMSETCYLQNYYLQDPLMCQSFEISFFADDTSKKQGNTRCVGIYEIELYNRLGPPLVEEYVDYTLTGYFGGVYVGSEETAHQKYSHNAFDGDLSTIWHTAWDGCSADERYMEVYLGKSADISGFRYYPRQGNKSGDNNGRVKGYEIYVGTMGSNGPAYRLVATGEWEDNGECKEVRFPVVENALFVKLVGVSTYGVKQNTWMSAAEIEFIATYLKTW